jgi:hypothetical protein
MQYRWTPYGIPNDGHGWSWGLSMFLSNALQ